jgi:chromosome partitioning protein
MSVASGVIVVASQKGGSGKTTLSGHIAVEAERAGDGPVALVDTDPQGSLAKWWNARAATAPLFARVPVAELGAGIAQLRRSGVKLIVIDTPPAVTEAISEVVAHADLVVAPTRPSPHDLRAVGPTVDIVERLKKPLVFVVNGATARARITAETAVALSQHGVVAPVTLHHRVDFAASMIDGRTVGEVREGSRSAQEVTSLWLYLRDRLARAEGFAGTAAADFATALLTPARPDDMIDFDEEDSNLGMPEIPTFLRQSSPIVPQELAAMLDMPTPQPVRPGYAPAAAPAAASPAASGWDGVDRRGSDRGPPAGMVDRRKVTTFGRRIAALVR